MAIIGRAIRDASRLRLANCDHLTEADLAELWASRVRAWEREWAEYGETFTEAQVERLKVEVNKTRAAEVAGRIRSGVYCRRCQGLHDANPSRYQLEERAEARGRRRA